MFHNEFTLNELFIVASMPSSSVTNGLSDTDMSPIGELLLVAELASPMAPSTSSNRAFCIVGLLSSTSDTHGLNTIEHGDDISGDIEPSGPDLLAGVFLLSNRFIKFGFESGSGEWSWKKLGLDNFESRWRNPGGLVMLPSVFRCRIMCGVEQVNWPSPIDNVSILLARVVA